MFASQTVDLLNFYHPDIPDPLRSTGNNRRWSSSQMILISDSSDKLQEWIRSGTIFSIESQKLGSRDVNGLKKPGLPKTWATKNFAVKV